MLLAGKQKKQITAIDATVLAVPTPTFKIQLLEETSADSKKLLCDCIVILSWVVNKINTHRLTAEYEIKYRLASFGHEIKRSFPKKTLSTYLWARAPTPVQSKAQMCFRWRYSTYRGFKTLLLR